MPRQTHNHAASSTSRFTPQFVLTDALALRARDVGPLQPPDPLLFLHEVRRVVDKDGIDVAGVHFMNPALRPFVGTKVELPVRFDAAAANRRQLTRVFVIIESTRDRSRSVIECLPRPYVRETTDREGFETESRRYRESIRQEIEDAVEATARRRGGHAAGERQRDLHHTRHHQGRAGQEQSGYRPPRPEVEAGVRKAAKKKLEQKLEKLDSKSKTKAKAKAKAKSEAEAKAKSKAKSEAKTGTSRAKNSAGARRQSAGRSRPGTGSAYDAWSQRGKAADSASQKRQKRSA